MNYKIIEKAPKSARSARTLHLPADLQAPLSALHDLQAIEAIEAGEAYAGQRGVHPRTYVHASDDDTVIAAEALDRRYSQADEAAS